MTIKLEVGKKYELNNGEVHKCERMIGNNHLNFNELGYGPFALNEWWYHQDGRFANCGPDHNLSVKRCVDDYTPKLWRDMTPEEKGALLLAHHEGKVIEWESGSGWHKVIIKEYLWCDDETYRVKPEPDVVEIDLFGFFDCKIDKFVFVSTSAKESGTHRITFNVIDGKPDCASIKMEEL